MRPELLPLDRMSRRARRVTRGEGEEAEGLVRRDAQLVERQDVHALDGAGPGHEAGQAIDGVLVIRP